VSGTGEPAPATEKKTLHASERDTPRVRALRGHWKRRVAAVDPAKLVFVDESGINTSMTRTRGRGVPGARVAGAVPQGHWTTLTMVGALRLDGMAAAATVNAATDTAIFHRFVRDGLVPALRPGDVVVWDGLGPHKVERVRQEVARAKAELMPLPPYSPDFSPIEPCWSKVKGHVRNVEPRTPEALGRAAAEGFASVTAADARAWFVKCGYCVH
jgi:transposase